MVRHTDLGMEKGDSLMSKMSTILRLFAAVALAVTFAVAAPGATMAASPTPAPANVMKPPAGWAALKASLNSDPNLQKTVSVSGNTRTITYASKDGAELVLQEPVAGTPANAVRPNVYLTGCGWFQECIVLNHEELTIISAFGVGGALAVLCGTPGVNVVACPLAAAIAGAVLTTMGFGHICPNGFKMEIFPYFGAPWNYGCW
jgi:hypothetical protein